MLHTYGYHKLDDEDMNTQIKLAAKKPESKATMGDKIKKIFKKAPNKEDVAAAKSVGSRVKRVGRYAGHVYGKGIAGGLIGAGTGAALGTLGGPAGTLAGAQVGYSLGATTGSIAGIRSAVKKEESLRGKARMSVRAAKKARLIKGGKIGAAVAGLSAGVYAGKKHLDKKKDSK